MRAGAMVALGLAAAIATGASIAAGGLPAQGRGHADDRAAGRSAPASVARITSARVRLLRGPVIELAADRTWTAALVAGHDCVVAWSPLRNQLVRLAEIASAAVARGRVLTQTPRAGTQSAEGARVTLVTSGGR